MKTFEETHEYAMLVLRYEDFEETHEYTLVSVAIQGFKIQWALVDKG